MKLLKKDPVYLVFLVGALGVFKKLEFSLSFVTSKGERSHNLIQKDIMFYI
ncbi:hypothetical protein Pf1_00646 [Flavobacterium columnare]|nr:hypothetical protein Pf1_00646 [Flavobacterium columnare]